MSHSRTRTFIKNLTLTSIASSILAISTSSHAADAMNKNGSEKVLDEVVVTAFRLPTSASKTGASVWILDQQQIKDRGFVYLTDALASVPGVTINQNGPFGGQASARIRGASSDQTLVMLDGVIINDTSTPGGGFNFGSIELTDIERIEVLKGPQSTLWGTDAIGGVINIVSKETPEGFNAEVGSSVGSFDSRQYRGTVSARNDVGDIRLNVSDTKTDGISKADEDDGNNEDDGYEAQTLALKAGINLPGDARLQLNHRETDTDTEFDSFGVTTGVQDGDEVSSVEQSTTQLRLTFPAFDGRLTNNLVYAKNDIERENFTAGVSGFSSEGERTVLQYQGTFQINESQQISIGYEDESSEANSNDSDIDGFYGLYQISPMESVTVSMGLRQDDHSEYGKETVGRISAAWAATDALNFQASWGEGFKAPTIFQTTFFCCGATAPNPDLQAESSDAIDIGFTWQIEDRGMVGLTYFQQETDNQIDFSFAVGGYENIEKVDSKGLELIFDYQINSSLFTTANVAYIDSEDVNGDRLVRVPELTADVELSWQINDRIRSTLAAVYNGDEEDSRGTVGSWTRFDVSGTWLPNDNIEVFARIENLTNKDYQQIFGYGTPKRSGYVGINYLF